jgi:hypothetical protein
VQQNGTLREQRSADNLANAKGGQPHCRQNARDEDALLEVVEEVLERIVVADQLCRPLLGRDA